MNRHKKSAWILPGITLIFLIKLILVEYFYFIHELSRLVTIKKYLQIQTLFYMPYKLALVIFVVSWAYLMRPKKGIVYLTVVSFANAVLVMALSMYIKAFNKLPSASVFQTIPNRSAILASIGDLLEMKYVLLFIDCFMLLYLAIKIKEDDLPSPKRAIGILCLALSIGILIWMPMKIQQVAEENRDPGYQFYHQDALRAVTNHSYGTYCVREIASIFWGQSHTQVTEQEKTELAAWLEQRKALLSNASTAYEGLAKGKNVLMIQVESLESVLINKTLNGKEITPFLNSIVRDSLYFPNIYEQVREGNSSDAEFMVNTSLYPLRHGVTAYTYSEREYPYSLANLLKQQGYYAFVTHGDRKTFWNRNNLYPGLGYDAFWGIEDFDLENRKDEGQIIGLGMADKSFLEQTAQKMGGIQEPYLASVITLTSHMPFSLPEEAKVTLFSEVADEKIRKAAEAFAYVDASLEQFFKRLDANGKLENTVIVIYGDHEGLNKYYLMADTWQNDRRLPLIIYGLDSEGTTYNVIGGQIDIMPTLLYLLGSAPYDYPIVGKNLLNTDNGYVFFDDEMVGHIQDGELLEIERLGYDMSQIVIRSTESVYK